MHSDSDSSQTAKINHYKVQGFLNEDKDKDTTKYSVNLDIQLLQTNVLGTAENKIPQESTF